MYVSEKNVYIGFSMWFQASIKGLGMYSPGNTVRGGGCCKVFFTIVTCAVLPHPHDFVLIDPLPHFARCSTLSPLATTSLFSVHLPFFFNIPHINEIIQYLSFSDSSLSIMPSRSTQVVTNGKILLFFMAEQYHFMSITPPLSIHPLMDAQVVWIAWLLYIMLQ